MVIWETTPIREKSIIKDQLSAQKEGTTKHQLSFRTFIFLLLALTYQLDIEKSTIIVSFDYFSRRGDPERTTSLINKPISSRSQ